MVQLKSLALYLRNFTWKHHPVLLEIFENVGIKYLIIWSVKFLHPPFAAKKNCSPLGAAPSAARETCSHHVLRPGHGKNVGFFLGI